jgi:AcrR family transcriptional regulator
MASTKEPSPDQRVRLFEAAIKVALERGYAHVTLDAVARQAGLSKGGLLYHFRSKAELIKGLLTHYDDGWLARNHAAQTNVRKSGCTDPLAVAMLVAAAEVPFLLSESGGPTSSYSPPGFYAYDLLSRRLRRAC